jgi:hypothetical protein
MEAQMAPGEMVTDSVTGTVVQRLPNGFVLRTDTGEELTLEIAGDTIQELQELAPDTTTTGSAARTPHASVMDSRDVLFVLRQLEESEERNRMHVHYYTLADAGRRVVVWLSIAADRVPGG